MSVLASASRLRLSPTPQKRRCLYIRSTYGAHMAKEARKAGGNPTLELTLIGKVPIGKGLGILTQATWSGAECIHERAAMDTSRGLGEISCQPRKGRKNHRARWRVNQFLTGLSKSSRRREISTTAKAAGGWWIYIERSACIGGSPGRERGRLLVSTCF